jgi:hypothetical protein
MDKREIEALLKNWDIGDLISRKQARKKANRKVPQQ